MALFSTILKKEYNKSIGSNFPHSLAHAMAFFVAHHVLKKYVYASFSFSC